jgi:acyl-coenzyme A synthetase/AMP-(fatty) acid ligase
MFLLDAGANARMALTDAASGASLTYAALRASVAATAARLAAPAKQLVFLTGTQEMATVLAYAAIIEAGHVVAWIDPALAPDALEHLSARYQPDGVWRDGAVAVSPSAERLASRPPIHEHLACLLSTSGTTGSVKLVRLRRTSLEANARAIAHALALGPEDVALASLPLSHAFGLSVVGAQWAAGGCVVLTGAPILSGEFWAAARRHRVTVLAGVPMTFELLRRLGPQRVVPSSVRLMIQAGGRLGPDDVAFFRAFMAERGGDFRVMYGQTEATARIAVWPRDIASAKIGSVGRVIGDGRIRVDAAGELHYRGSGVMMGYANCRADLARPSEVDELATGDLGALDADGFLYVTGRRERVAKLAGLRINLDEVEQLLGRQSVAAIERRGRLCVFVEAGDAAPTTADVSRRVGLDVALVEVLVIERLPRTRAGKIEYARLDDGR